jgi:hypothetical protein
LSTNFSTLSGKEKLMARTREPLPSLSAGSLLMEISAIQNTIDEHLSEVERLRIERDDKIALALDTGITYRLLQQDTGLARSTLIKINAKGTSK